MLMRGSQGDEVRCLQFQLNQAARQPLQFTKFPPLETDGIFGGLTQARLQEFQTLNGLAPDGIVGPRTRATLDALVGPVELRRPAGGTKGYEGIKSPVGDKDFVSPQFGTKKWYPAGDYGKLPAGWKVTSCAPFGGGKDLLGSGTTSIGDVKGPPGTWWKW